MTDIHGNLDIFDNMASLNKEARNIEIKKYANMATDFSSLGFDQKQIEELLKIEGCSAEVAKDISISSSSNIPIKYDLGHAPQSYADVKKIVEASVVSGDIDKIKEYFERHASKYSEIVPMILVARANQSQSFLNEIHNELRPLIEGILLKNTVEAKNTNEVSLNLSEKDNLEMGLFGVWPVLHIKKSAERMRGEDNLIEKSKEESHNISYTEKYKDRTAFLNNYFKKD